MYKFNFQNFLSESLKQLDKINSTNNNQLCVNVNSSQQQVQSLVDVKPKDLADMKK